MQGKNIKSALDWKVTVSVVQVSCSCQFELRMGVTAQTQRFRALLVSEQL